MTDRAAHLHRRLDLTERRTASNECLYISLMNSTRCASRCLIGCTGAQCFPNRIRIDARRPTKDYVPPMFKESKGLGRRREALCIGAHVAYVFGRCIMSALSTPHQAWRTKGALRSLSRGTTFNHGVSRTFRNVRGLLHSAG